MTFKKFTQEEKCRMAEQYMEGTGLAALATVHGVSTPTMAKYVRAGGGVVRPPGTIRGGNGDFVKTMETVITALAASVVKLEEQVPATVEPTPSIANARVLLPMD